MVWRETEGSSALVDLRRRVELELHAVGSVSPSAGPGGLLNGTRYGEEYSEVYELVPAT